MLNCLQSDLKIGIHKHLVTMDRSHPVLLIIGYPGLAVWTVSFEDAGGSLARRFGLDENTDRIWQLTPKRDCRTACHDECLIAKTRERRPRDAIALAIRVSAMHEIAVAFQRLELGG
jgi:hypothetical protein